MEKNTNSITECLNQMISLTKKNLSILKTINESFYTKRNHLTVVTDDETYVIPSFISLESRIDALENNLQHIADAPLTGEAFTYFDSTTQRIELAGYSTTPNHVELSMPDRFEAEHNNIFKDFMNPNPYVKFDISSIPNNIKHVQIKKIAIYNQDIISALNNITSENGGPIEYAEALKILYGYDSSIDYNEYDTIRRLPIRTGVAQGEYDIIEIIDNYQDSNFDEFYELKLDRAPVYYIKNGTIQKDIAVGDNLVTYNDKVMLEVTEVLPLSNKMTVKVMYGAYADLQDVKSNNIDLYRIKYYKSASDIDSTKYINIPLEEDRYVLIFAAPVNDTTNTQAPWGTGVFLDVDTLVIPDPDVPNTTISFREYYNQYVNNIGDALLGITTLMDDDEQISRLSSTEFNMLCGLKPIIDSSLIKVTQINKHLNDTKSIQTIRNLYNQKAQYKSDLEVIQRNIDNITKDLAELSFDDSANTRTVYETQLKEYNTKKNDLVSSIEHIIQEISLNTNDSETPIENAKYRIRGFINIDPREIIPDVPDYVQVIKIDVEYRYKNKSSFTGNAETFDSYIFSDWNKMDSIYRKKVPYFIGNQYKYKWEDLNDDTNNPSFNQIDIPITQGEIVDIRARYIYNLGYPFAEMVSAWSDIYTQEFPQEFTKNIEILDIIAENNDEIRTNHFKNILSQSGVYKHLDDELQDQSILYMHKAEHITSGFVTEERRVIPLNIKLMDLNDTIEELKAEVYGSSSSNLIVTLSDSMNMMQLKPNIINAFHTLSYKNSISKNNAFKIGNHEDDPLIAISRMNVNIYNNGTYTMKLHTLFPGASDEELKSGTPSLFDINDYAGTNRVAIMSDQKEKDANNQDVLYLYQRFNQFIYFHTRLADMTSPDLYRQASSIADAIVNNDNISNGMPLQKQIGSALNLIEIYDLNGTSGDILRNAMAQPNQNDNINRMAFLYPYIGGRSEICVPAGNTYISIKPGESVNIPLDFAYWFREDNSDVFKSLLGMRNITATRAIAFDIRTSLYQNPITFKIVVDASFDDTVGFQLKTADQIDTVATLSKLNSTIAQSGMTPQNMAVSSTASLKTPQARTITFNI